MFPELSNRGRPVRSTIESGGSCVECGFGVPKGQTFSRVPGGNGARR